MTTYTGTVTALEPIAALGYNFFLGYGRGRIAGTTKTKSTPSNIPAQARVRLYRDTDGAYVAETWSNAGTGAYTFQYLSVDYTYTAIAFDPTLSQRAEAADRVTPEPMP
jgi:hypothetical protein